MFIIAFPASKDSILVLKQTTAQLQADAIMMRYMQDILRLRIGESMVINNKYLVVRVG